MRQVITSLAGFVHENAWFQRLYEWNFGIILPNGWLGRPGDERYILESARVEGDTLYMKIDCDTEMEITAPTSYELSPNAISSKLTFFDCRQIKFRQAADSRTFQSNIGNSLSLVGFFKLEDVAGQ